MAFDYHKLRGAIREKYQTQENFAREIGISCASLSAKLNNRVEFSQEEMNLAISALDISTGEIAAYFFTPIV